MTQQIIDREGFISRLTALCVRGSARTLPRRRSDRAILLRSIAQRLAGDRAYTQPEINAVIEEWRRIIAPALDIDHVSLRRALVDEEFLEREAGGAKYRRGAGPLEAIAFVPDVEEVDGEEVVAAARRAVAERRRRHLPRLGDESADSSGAGS